MGRTWRCSGWWGTGLSRFPACLPAASSIRFLPSLIPIADAGDMWWGHGYSGTAFKGKMEGKK